MSDDEYDAVRRLTGPELLRRVYDLQAEDRAQEATIATFEWVDRKCHAGAWEEIDGVLSGADVGRLASIVRRSLLCITYCVKDRLPSRPAFFDAAYAATIPDRGPERTARIVSNLR